MIGRRDEVFSMCALRRYLSILCVGLVSTLVVSRAAAQTSTTTVFVAPPEAADSSLREALEQALPELYRALTGSGQVTIAADSEMEAVVSSCREQVGASPAEERRCQVQAARIAAMDHVLVLDARFVGDSIEVSLQALAAEDAGELFADAVLATGSPDESVGEAVPRLASAYLRWLSGADRAGACFDAVRAAEPPIPPQEVGAVLEVLDVDPSPLSVRVNGETVGYAPGQILGLQRGSVVVELAADGYRPQNVDVVLETDEVLTLSGINLEPLPGRIVVTSNIVGVTIEVDGVAAGTFMEAHVVAEVGPGRHRVTAQRSGYHTFRTEVTVLPGGETPLEAVLEVDAPIPIAAGETPVAPREPPRERVSPPRVVPSTGPNTATAGWVLLGTGLAVAAGGVIYDAANIGLRDDKQAAYAAADVVEWNRLDQEIADVRRAELIALGVGGAVAVIGLVLVLVDGGDDPADERVSRRLAPGGDLILWRFP